MSRKEENFWFGTLARKQCKCKPKDAKNPMSVGQYIRVRYHALDYFCDNCFHDTAYLYFRALARDKSQRLIVFCMRSGSGPMTDNLKQLQEEIEQIQENNYEK